LTLGLVVTLSARAIHAQQPTDAPLAVVEPQEPGGGSDDGYVERTRRWAKNAQVFERLSGSTDGWYPRFGGMTRGSGLTIGPGYRTHVFNDQVLVDLSAAISTKAYKAADAKVRWVEAVDKRFELWTDARYEVFPQEDFFGIGPDSSLAAQTSYDQDTADFAVRSLFRIWPSVHVGVVAGYMMPRIGQGKDRAVPSTEIVFADAQAPGLLEQPNFLHTTFFVELDRRDVPGRPASGGFYRASYGMWEDHTLDRYDFHRFDVEGIHYLPLTASKAHVLSGRVGTSYVNNGTGNRVPFYFLPYVGGVDTIRSFREYRFQDENALWLSAEYAWTPVTFMSLAAFADAGEVRSDWRDLGFSRLKRGYGFGIRVHSMTQTFARFDVGTGGGEGLRMFLKLGPSF
jgi:hypothetical protein